ncbi:MAG: methyltransferase domain-containing protein [Acholeplasma sp.]|nr:methyltransferase domain-containing protein [Acholeplasma sp.]
MTISKLKLHRDAQSGLVYKDVSHHISLEKEFARYKTHHNELDNPNYMAYQTSIFKSFIEPFVVGEKHLDFGCGEFGPLKQISGYDVALYDYFFHPNQSVLKSTYDTVWLIEVVEHFVEPMVEFERLYNLLDSRGRLLIQTEFMPQTGIENWWYLRDETHFSFYDDQVFDYIAKQFGFVIIDSNHKNRIVLEKK